MFFVNPETSLTLLGPNGPCKPARWRVVRYGFTVNKESALRAGAVAAAMTLVMLMASPALALTRKEGDDPGPGLSVIETIGLFVATPIALFAAIAGLVVVLDKSRKPRKAGESSETENPAASR